MLRGRYRGCCLSIALRTEYHPRVQAYSYIQLCNDIWLFRGKQNLYAVSSKTPLTFLAQRTQNLFLSTCSRFTFNSTSAAFFPFILPKCDGSCQPSSEHSHSRTHQSPKLHCKHFNGDTVLAISHGEYISVDL